ncbi:MAG: hypothetical protein QM791_10795 [Ferruginibacter sp.]
MNVLIVDGSEIIAERLVILVSETRGGAACDIHKATSYERAVDILNDVKPDIVLLDSSLPGNKSIVLFNTAKALNRNVCFIILFNYANTVVQRQYNLMGADFIFDKYLDFEKIPAAIDSIAAKKKLIHEPQPAY